MKSIGIKSFILVVAAALILPSQAHAISREEVLEQLAAIRAQIAVLLERIERLERAHIAAPSPSPGALPSPTPSPRKAGPCVVGPRGGHTLPACPVEA